MTFFYLVFAFFAVSMLMMYVLVRSPFGRSLAGIRERELRMQILGYNTRMHKYIAFIIAGGFGGLAGVLWAHTNGHVSPETVVLTTSVDLLLMVVPGGAGTLVGACFGAAIVFGLREYLSTLVPWWQYALGGVYVLTILYLPMGLMGIPARIPGSGWLLKELKTRKNWHRSRPDVEQDGKATREELTMTSNYKNCCSAVVWRQGLASTVPAGAEELRIGYISPVTGIFAQVGKDMVDGFQLYLDEHGGKLGGMDVKFIVEDDQAKPDLGVTKAKKLILNDKVHMLIGGLLASTGYALAPVSTAEKTIYLSSVSSADDLTQRQLDKYPYFLRTSWTSSLPHHALGQWACDNGYNKVIAIAAEYAFGYETVGGFQSAFEACGGKVIQKIWPTLCTKDFGTYITTYKADADAIFTTMVGPDGAAISQAVGRRRQHDGDSG